MTTIFQNDDHIVNYTGFSQKIFNKGFLGNGSFPVLAGKSYEFEINLFLGQGIKDVYFKMLGDVNNVTDVVYNASNNNCSYADFQENAIGDFDINDAHYSFGKVSGTFKCVQNGYLIPAFNSSGVFLNLSTIGSYFKIKEIKTTSNII